MSNDCDGEAWDEVITEVSEHLSTLPTIAEGEKLLALLRRMKDASKFAPYTMHFTGDGIELVWRDGDGDHMATLYLGVKYGLHFSISRYATYNTMEEVETNLFERC